MARVLINYDDGSMSPSDLVTTCSELGVEPMFLVQDNTHCTEVAVPILQEWGAPYAIRSDHRHTSWRLAVEAFQPNGVVTFAERQLSSTADVALEFGLPRSHTVDTVSLLTDKRLQRSAFARAGIPGPRQVSAARLADLSSGLDSIGLPCVVKPAVGYGSRYTFRIADRADYKQLIAADLCFPVVIESELIGRVTPAPWADYVAIDYLVQDGHATIAAVLDKFALAKPFRERGGFMPHALSSVDLRRADEVAVAAIEALGLRHGMVEVELKLTSDGPVPIEINGRLGGWADKISRGAYGYSPAKAAIAYAVGQRATAPGLNAFCHRTDPRITFIYQIMLPIGHGQLTTPLDVAALRRIAGVHRVILIGDGNTGKWEDGTLSSIATVHGSTENRWALAKVVSEIETVLRPSL